MEKILKYLEKRPRELVLVVLVFTAGVTAVSGLCLYVLNEIVQNERQYAQAEAILAKEHFESRLEVIKDRVKLNSQDVDRLVNAFVPVLKKEIEQLEEIRKILEKEPDSKISQDIRLKVDIMLQRDFELIQRLESTRIIEMIPTVTGPVPTDWVGQLLLPRLIWASVIIAALSSGLAFLIFHRRKPSKSE